MIGWYAHHHGAGHLARAMAVRARLRRPVTVFSSRPHPDAELLPLDVDPPRTAACAAVSTATATHHSPVGVDGLRRRMGRLAAWMADVDPDAFVVDVSVEVASLVRLLGVPGAIVRQHGRRDDVAHLRAYADAQLLLAPWPTVLEPLDTPPEVLDRTVHVGGFSRFDDRPVDRLASRDRLGIPAMDPLAVVIGGAGGGCWPVEEAVAATPGWRWGVLGGGSAIGPSWVEDPWDWLCAADVVVTHCGHNALVETAAAGRPVIAIPFDRPFDEQRDKAACLVRAGMGTVLDRWPMPDRWPALLARAIDGRTTLPGLVDGHGAERAAVAIEDLAHRMGRPAVAA